MSKADIRKTLGDPEEGYQDGNRIKVDGIRGKTNDLGINHLGYKA